MADDLRQAIAAGTYQPGEQLPTLAELTARYGIAVMTARDAIRQLVTEGLVVSRQGKGAYVLRQPRAEESITCGRETLAEHQNPAAAPPSNCAASTSLAAPKSFAQMHTTSSNTSNACLKAPPD